MTKLYYYSLRIQIFVSFYVNHCLVAANPLIGVNVSPARLDEFPSIVSLGKAPGNDVLDHFCAGTLISKRHVLTAAHCVKVNNETESYMMPGGIVVTVGSIDTSEGTKYHVKKWTMFEEWTSEKRVTLANDVVENIKPAHLSSLNYESVSDKNLVVAGWGITNFNNTPNRLLRADLRVIDGETCLDYIDNAEFPLGLIVNHFCTIARPPISLGRGDSGGPIFVNGDEIVGVNIADCEDHEHPNQ